MPKNQEALTPWFAGHTRPYRKGWYDTRFHGGKIIVRFYWDGFLWKVSKRSPNYPVVWQSREWRGLAAPY